MKHLMSVQHKMQGIKWRAKWQASWIGEEMKAGITVIMNKNQKWTYTPHIIGKTDIRQTTVVTQ